MIDGEDQAEARPMISAGEVVEWLEDWKAFVSVEWGDICEKCLYIGFDGLIAERDDLIRRLKEVRRIRCCKT